MKHFSLSKINWLGVITAAIGILSLANQLNLSEDTMKVIMVITGVLTVILRTFFTSEPVRV